MAKSKKAHPKNKRNSKKKFSSRARQAGRVLVKKLSKTARAEMRKAVRLKAQRAAERQREKELALAKENDRLRVDELVKNEVFADFISKNVGKKAISIIRLLNDPQTDEKLAADLSIKINEVRRMLNVLDSYGVARYDTNKDNKGWLTFKWYLDSEKLSELNQTVANSKPGSYKLPEDCNDFFYCGKCYEEQKVILPFDAAYEAQFKCESCSKQLRQLSKDEARALFENSAAEPKVVTPA